MLRSHQKQFTDACRRMKSSTSLRTVLAHIQCGGGKSALPVIAAHELVPAIGDFVAWLTPRDGLRNQAEDAFTAGWLRNLIGHSNEIRGTANDADLLRGKVGYATTYQALIAARSYKTNPHVKLFSERRGILFLDEPNHVADGEEFALAVQPLIERCAAVVFMGGHFSRHDGKRLAFINYLPKDKNGRSFVDMGESDTQTCIRYSLRDATRERALIKINFELRDCRADWDVRNADGVIVNEDSIDSFDGASRDKTRKGLYSALDTDFFEELVVEGAEFWLKRKRHNPRSRLFVVCPFISHAQDADKLLKKMEITNAGIATSDDSKALEIIERFKHNQLPHLDALSSVGMVYEGVDVPPADVLICATHIRSREWIDQVLHRVTRNDTEGLPWERQFATIFAPKDRFFVEIMEAIKRDQAPYVEERIGPPPPSPPKDKSTLNPRGSEKTKSSAQTLENDPVEGEQYENIVSALRSADIHGAISATQAREFIRYMSSEQIITPKQPTCSEKRVEPPRVREKKLKDQIKDLQRAGYDPEDPETSERIAERGKRLWRVHRKRVEDMTELQLQFVVENSHLWAVP